MSLAGIDIKGALSFTLGGMDKDYSSEMEGEPEPRREPSREPTPEEAKLWALARRLFEPGRAYSSDEVLSIIQRGTGIDQERALKGFIKLGQAGALIPVYGDRYFRGDSSPF